MPTKQLFLGGGAEGKIKDMDALFASILLKTESQKLLYLPIAHPEIVINNVQYTHKKLYMITKEYFAQYGISEVDLWTDLSNKTYKDIDSYGAIFIGGGNTFNLLNQLKRTGFDGVLSRYIDEGKPVYGSSAGAAILARTIDTVRFGADPDTNGVNLWDLSALNKINGYNVICHYSSREDEGIADYSKKSGIRVICLPSGTGIYVDGDAVRIFGNPKEICLFEGSKKTKIDDGKLLRLS